MAGPRHQLDYYAPDGTRPRSWLARHWGKLLGAVAAMIALVVIVFYAVLFRYERVLDQRLALARQHIAVITPVIAADPRFANVELSEFTPYQGCIKVSGAVESSETLAALQAKIIATSPPVDVYWSVSIHNAKPSTAQ